MGGRKILRDTNAPKRPLSGFMRFCSKNRGKCEGSVTEIVKQLGEKWAKLSESAKKNYNDQAQKDWTKWKSKWAAYKKTKKYGEFAAAKAKERQRKRLAARRAPADENRPKKACSAFLHFSVSHRKAGGDLKSASTEWKKMTNRGKWETMAAKDKAREKKEVEKYMKTKNYAKHLKMVEEFKKNLPPTPAEKAREKRRKANERKRTAAKKRKAKEVAKERRARRAASKKKKAEKKKATLAKKKAATARKREKMRERKAQAKAKAAVIAKKKKAAAAKKKAAVAKKKAVAAKKKAAAAKKKKAKKAKRASKKKTKSKRKASKVKKAKKRTGRKK